MAKPCDLCGRNIIGLGAYDRALNNGKTLVNICGYCEVKLTGLTDTTNETKTKESVEWGKEILNNEKYNPDIYNDFCEQLNMAEQTIKLEQPDSNKLAENSHNNIPTAQQHRTITDSSMWTEMLKIISVIAVIGLTIAGAVIGGALADGVGIFLGFLFGLLVGMISISTLMVFVNMAEDAKATRAYVRQIRDILDKNPNNTQ